MTQQPMSKQDEIDALRKFAAKFDHNTYLHDLFTDEFFMWIEKQVHDDLPPDLRAALDLANLRYAEVVNKKDAEIEGYKTGIRKLSADLEASAELRMLDRKRIDELVEGANQTFRIMQEKESAIDRMHNQLVDVSLLAANHWLDGTDIKPVEIRDIVGGRA